MVSHVQDFGGGILDDRDAQSVRRNKRLGGPTGREPIVFEA